MKSHFSTFLDLPSNRTPVFDTVLGYLNQKPAHILEIGVARNLSEAARQSDGWSSMHFGHYISRYGGVIDLVDISQESLNNAKELMLSLPSIPPYTLNCRDGRDFLKNNTCFYDIVLLDGSDDAGEMLECFELARCCSRFILCDDFQSKGQLLKESYPIHHLFHWSNHAFEMALYSSDLDWKAEMIPMVELQK